MSVAGVPVVEFGTKRAATQGLVEREAFTFDNFCLFFKFLMSQTVVLC